MSASGLLIPPHTAWPRRRCEVKVIDLGSSCFITDQLSSYVQSRSYRAPEVILGLPYDYKVGGKGARGCGRPMGWGRRRQEA